MINKLLAEHHLEFLSLKGGCKGSSESRHVKMPHCWKSHALAQIFPFDFDLVFGRLHGLIRACLSNSLSFNVAVPLIIYKVPRDLLTIKNREFRSGK